MPRSGSTRCGTCSTPFATWRRPGVAVLVARPAAVDRRVPASAALVSGRGLRGHRPRYADDPATRRRARGAALGDDSRRAHDAVHAGERRPRRLRLGQEEERLEGACGRDTLGHLLVLTVTAANEQERAQVADLAAQEQEVTCGTMEVALVDQGYTGDIAAEHASEPATRLEVVKHAEVKKVLCSCRGAGWSSGPSTGWGDSADWRATTSDSPKHSPAGTGSPSSLLSSPRPDSKCITGSSVSRTGSATSGHCSPRFPTPRPLRAHTGSRHSTARRHEIGRAHV